MQKGKGMRTIRKLTRRDLDAMIDVVSNAYPGMKVVSEAEKNRVKERLWEIERIDPEIHLYGLFQNKALHGVMRLFDFTMHMLSVDIPLGGIGLVAVDLTHKKEHVCKEMVEYYMDYYAKRKTPMLALYAFRPDFYHKMGFGYGTKINEYRIKPGELPKGLSKEHIVFAGKKDQAALDACYHRVMANTHGLFRRTKTYIRALTRPGNFIVACRKKNKITGFIVYTFETSKDNNWLHVEMNVLELIYESREAFLELVAFLQSQFDQVHCISLKTQDDFFHFVPNDARTDSGRLIFPVGHETNAQGIGIMYRVIDTVDLFRRLKNHDFNGQTCRLKITIDDSFYPKHAGSYIVHFDKGKPQVKARGAVDAEISLDVADFSSLITGVVPFDKLYEYGRAEISDLKYLDTVTKIFSVDRKPVCVTQF